MKILPFLAFIGCAHAQTPIANGNFESDPFDSGWTNTGAVTVDGFALGSSQGARFTGSGQSLKQSVSWEGNWHLDFFFIVRESDDRQFALIIETGNGATALNLRYDESEGGWFAFSNGWGSPFDLDPVLPSVDVNGDGDVDDDGEVRNVYHMRVTGRDWGNPWATYDLALSDANGTEFVSNVTGLSRYQAAPAVAPTALGVTPTGFNFSTEFGGNPGYWLDDVSSHLDNPAGPSPTISYFVADGNTLNWQSADTTSLTLNPGGIDVTGLTSFSVSPSSTTTYTLTAASSEGETSADFTIGVGEEALLPVIINEFLAINPKGEDWIELYNPNAFSVNLENWALSDDDTDLTQFTFPPTAIAPNGYLVIEASELDFGLRGGGEYLGLSDPLGVITTEFTPSFPAQFSGVSYGVLPTGGLGFFGTPTPGTVNVSSPFIADYQETIHPDQSITVSAMVSGDALSSVELIHRVSFGPEVAITMTNTGGNIYQATIPSGLASPGEMLRWRITAEDGNEGIAQNPTFKDPLDSPRYYGTVIADPTLTSQLPVLQWFVSPEDLAAVDTRDGARCSIYWLGEFYDNILVHLRGATTATLEKKPHQFEFNDDHDFLIAPGIPLVDQINVNAAYPDASYLRDVIAMEHLWTMGVRAPEAFPIRVEQNNGFYSLGIMIEQPDGEYLERHDDIFDPDGSFYQASGNASWLISANGFEARNNSDLADLTTFANDLNGAPNQLDYLYENVDLASCVNYLAVNVVDSIFNPQKNYYMHRNKFNEWMFTPWDRDFSLGHRWLGSSDPRGPAGPVDRLLFDERIEWGGSDDDGRNGYNRLFNAIYDDPQTSQMFYRRLRTAIDTLLASGATNDRIEELRILVKQEADLDRDEWGFSNDRLYRNFPQERFDAGLDRILNTYLSQRLDYLENDGGSPARGTLPPAHSSAPSINFGTIIANPSSGNQDEETIELLNPNDFAVDISSWQITGGVTHEMRPGTVIPANGSLVLSPDIELYRSLNTPRFTQGNYSGNLSNFSETLTLSNVEGVTIATIETPNAPSDNQRYLRISEIMYNPADGNDEFIELINTSDDVTLILDGVTFSDAFEYTFPEATTLTPGQRIVVNEPDFTDGTLSNGGDTVKLDDSDGSTIQEFTYDDNEPWPSAADGDGRSIVFRGGDPNLPESWRASLANGGTPGTSDSVPYTGGDILSYALSGTIQFDVTTNILTVPLNPGADDVSLIPQWSTNLQNWDPENFIYQGQEQWLFEPTTPLDKVFFRLGISLD